jgi:hypothetical protein
MLPATDEEIEREDGRGNVRKACLVEVAQLLVVGFEERPANKTWCRNCPFRHAVLRGSIRH